jgi:hypothetical protein
MNYKSLPQNLRKISIEYIDKFSQWRVSGRDSQVSAYLKDTDWEYCDDDELDKYGYYSIRDFTEQEIKELEKFLNDEDERIAKEYQKKEKEYKKKRAPYDGGIIDKGSFSNPDINKHRMY